MGCRSGRNSDEQIASEGLKKRKAYMEELSLMMHLKVF